MKTAFASLATLAFLVAHVVGQFTINTPSNVVVCQPIRFTWSGGTAPYFLSILPGADPTASALEDLGQQTGTEFTWVANIAAGTSLGLTLRDSSGLVAQSAPFTINPGTDTSCVGKSSVASSSSTSSGASSSSVSSASSSVSTSSALTTATPASTTSKSTTTTTSPATKATTGSASSSGTTPSSTSHNGGPTQAASFAVAGMVGAAVVALLA